MGYLAPVEDGGTATVDEADSGAVDRLPRWAVGVLVGFGLALLTCSLITPFAFVPDDALFYLVIARNIVGGDGITFSHVMGTNGFQPLWQAVVAGLVGITQPLGLKSDASQVALMVAASWAFLAGGLVLLERLLRRLGTAPIARFAALAVVLVLLGGPYGTLATEASMVLLALVVVLLAARRLILATNADALRWSALLGVAVAVQLLARLDTVFVAATTLLVVLVVLGRRHDWRRAFTSVLVAGLVTTACIAPYLLWNLVRFGHLNPISGAVKLDTSRIWLVADSVGPTGWLLVIGALVLGAAGAALAPHRGDLWPWAAIATGALAASTFYFLFSPGKLTNAGWYQAPHILGFALGSALLVDRVAARLPRIAPVVAIGSTAVLALTLVFVVQYRVQGANVDQANAVRQFGRDADAALPEDAIVVTVDYPGYVALVTRRPVIALDGLTGDYDFQDDLRDRGGECALAERGATHLVTDTDSRLAPAPDGPPTARIQEVASWLYDESAGVLTVDERDRLVSDPKGGLELWTLSVSCG